MSTGIDANAIRVLHIVGDSRFGGIAQIIAGLGRVAEARGWAADVLSTDPTVQEFVRQAGMGVVSLDVIRRPIRPWDLIGLIRLWRFLRRDRYHIVHTHTSKGGFVGRLAATCAGVPVVVHTAHGFAFHERSSRRMVRFYSLLEWMASHWCDRIITVSDFHRRWAIELGICGPHRIEAIPNGVAALPATPAETVEKLRAQFGVRRDELLIFTNARLAEDKGLEYLIEAAADLCRRRMQFRILIAGEGPVRERLEKMAIESEVAHVVTFLGFRQDVGDLLAACDVAVFPSLREGLSIALLEAMSAGKPIVATSIGSVRDLASQAEMVELAAPANSDALADALYNVGTNPVWQAVLARNARELFDARYTEKRMLSSYQDLYLQLLRRKSPVSHADVPACTVGDRPGGQPHIVRPAGTGDLPEIVRVHQRAFSEFFLTRLGEDFLRRYYELVLDYQSGIVLTREKDGVLQGFVCGFVNPPEFYRLMWRNKRVFMLPALGAVLRNPSLTSKMLSGIQRVQTSAAQAQPVTCELSSVAVMPEVSGNGVGKSLVRAFLAHSWNMQAECVSLTTDADENDTANRLYRDTGFTVVRRFLQRKDRWMNEYVIQRPLSNTLEEGRP
jgi:glycosyltransferase involved in cell wall biosynthesis/ribosomal protein S18 acetylase RimI-like enzyme